MTSTACTCPRKRCSAAWTPASPTSSARTSPTEGKAGFDDLIYRPHGRWTCSTLDDNVLIKADGLPTYNFANVIDDHLMGITHVIRGTEYLSSAPKYNLLYEAFGWEPPTYIHLPPVMDDAQRKLSKRYGDPSFEDLLDQGLSEGSHHQLSSPSWAGAPSGEREIFSLEELEEVFDAGRASASLPPFSTWTKLTLVQRRIHAQACSPRNSAKLAEPWYGRGAGPRQLRPYNGWLDLMQTRTEVLNAHSRHGRLPGGNAGITTRPSTPTRR